MVSMQDTRTELLWLRLPFMAINILSWNPSSTMWQCWHWSLLCKHTDAKNSVSLTMEASTANSLRLQPFQDFSFSILIWEHVAWPIFQSLLMDNEQIHQRYFYCYPRPLPLNIISRLYTLEIHDKDWTNGWVDRWTGRQMSRPLDSSGQLSG